MSTCVDVVVLVDDEVVVVVAARAVVAEIVVEPTSAADGEELRSDPDVHDSSNGEAATSAQHRQAVRITAAQRSVQRDHDAAVAVRLLLALDEAADLGQELGDLGHESVLGLDLDANRLRARAR